VDEEKASSTYVAQTAGKGRARGSRMMSGRREVEMKIGRALVVVVVYGEVRIILGQS